jgi:predicted PurR-regulated permease PerM
VVGPLSESNISGQDYRSPGHGRNSIEVVNRDERFPDSDDERNHHRGQPVGRLAARMTDEAPARGRGQEGRRSSVEPATRSDQPVGTTARLISARTTRQLVVLGFALIALGAGLYLARGTIVPFVIALLGAYLIMPLVDVMAGRRIPRWLGILIVYAGGIAVAYFILRFVVPPLIEQAQALIAAIPALLGHLRDWYLGLDLDPSIRAFMDKLIATISDAVRTIDMGTILGPVFQSVSGLLLTIVGYAFVPFFVFYVVLDKERLLRGFDRGLPAEWRGDIWAVLGIGDRVFGQWIRSTIVLGAILGVSSLIGMGVFAVIIDPVFGRFAVVLATIAFFSEFVPIIGPFFPLVAGVLVGLTVSPGAALAAGLFYFILAQVEANLLVPRIQGQALALHPAAVITVLIMGTAATGLLGALLAIPIVAALGLIIRYLFRRASGLIDPPPPTRQPPEPGPLVDALIPGVVRES